MNDKSAKLLEKIAEKKVKKKSDLDKLLKDAEKADTVKKLKEIVIELIKRS